MIEERIGYFGFKKKKIIDDLNQRYGNKWKLLWKWGSSYLTQDQAIQHYEDAYVNYFAAHPNILEWLTKHAKDVYDTSLTNLQSGLDYTIQEDRCTHLQDIAIRRAVLRLGYQFSGNTYLQVRGKDSEGYFLNPGQVPFHMPEMIIKPSLQGWWKENSIEDFYQSNKVVVVDDLSPTQ